MKTLVYLLVLLLTSAINDNSESKDKECTVSQTQCVQVKYQYSPEVLCYITLDSCEKDNYIS